MFDFKVFLSNERGISYIKLKRRNNPKEQSNNTQKPPGVKGRYLAHENSERFLNVIFSEKFKIRTICDIGSVDWETRSGKNTIGSYEVEMEKLELILIRFEFKVWPGEKSVAKWRKLEEISQSEEIFQDPSNFVRSPPLNDSFDSGVNKCASFPFKESL